MPRLEVCSRIFCGTAVALRLTNRHTINNVKWDVKSFVSFPNGHTSPKKGAFTVNNGMKAINKELDENYNVIVDKRDMIPEHVKQLKEAIEKAGISDRVIWYP